VVQAPGRWSSGGSARVLGGEYVGEQRDDGFELHVRARGDVLVPRPVQRLGRQPRLGVDQLGNLGVDGLRGDDPRHGATGSDWPIRWTRSMAPTGASRSCGRFGWRLGQGIGDKEARSAVRAACPNSCNSSRAAAVCVRPRLGGDYRCGD